MGTGRASAVAGSSSEAPPAIQAAGRTAARLARAVERMPMISSTELAELCGVSRGTVDRALHGRGRVSEETKKRILAKAKEYGYVPNPVMHEIMRGVSKVVGAVMPETGGDWCQTVLRSVSVSAGAGASAAWLAAAANSACTGPSQASVSSSPPMQIWSPACSQASVVRSALR